MELVGQGVANVASAFFGGLPATGAIARTAANVKSGGRTPFAGIFHSAFLLLFVVLGSDLMAFVPMAVLAAVLLVVAWGMSEARRFVLLLRMPIGGRAILIVTFLLTVLVDLTVAIGVGMVLAAFPFIRRMASVTEVNVVTRELAAEPEDDEPGEQADPTRPPSAAAGSPAKRRSARPTEVSNELHRAVPRPHELGPGRGGEPLVAGA